MPISIAYPPAQDVPEFFKGYVAELEPGTDGVAALERQQQTIAALGRIRPEQASFRYADGKWSVKEVIGHVTDTERIFAYRLLRIARGDQTPLASFDEKKYAASSNADKRDLADLVNELSLVRRASVALVRSLDERALANCGTVPAGELTARAQVFIIAGHFAHHAKILQERYSLAL